MSHHVNEAGQRNQSALERPSLDHAMNSATRALVEDVDLAKILPPHLTQIYEKVHCELVEAYGESPGVTALLRLWIARGTSREVRREFERAILDIHRKTLNPSENAEFDEDCI